MLKPKYGKKIAAVILIAAIIIVTLVTIRYFYPPEKLSASTMILPGQTYFAWDGKAVPSGYVFHEIRYNLYINGAVVYGSSTINASWTCPEYVYGQEDKASSKVDYAMAWTELDLTTVIP